MTRPFISIVIPCYNSSTTIVRTIFSIKQQNYDNLEVIIVDDGSSDDLYALINSFTDLTIKYIKTDNRGVSSARNIGCESANGEYIFFVDADDELDSGGLHSLVSVPEFFKYDMIGGLFSTRNRGCLETENKLTFNLTYCNDEFLECCLKDHPFGYYVWRYLYKKSFLVNIKFKVGISRSEDSLFLFECALKKPFVFILNRSVYIYNENPNSATHQKISTKNVQDILYTLDEKKRQLDYKNLRLNTLYKGHVAKAHMMLLRNYLFCDKSMNNYVKRSLKEFGLYKKYINKDENLDIHWFRILKYKLFYMYRFFYKYKYKLKIIRFLFR